MPGAADWDPALYTAFEDERTRPARDLLARVGLDRPAFAVDLGCGPGNSTALLRDRFPEAEILGLDTS
ncbi:MAG: trans-aconitate 2-methyltransferase, partial [Parafilimonas terrae]|nr:trans-aconitate 2-methyltransferase [Parafilimonas terrae]